MLLSVITVSFNSASTIAETMRSVQCQTYPHLEHIVVDGESTDDSLAVINACSDERTKVISEPDDGIYDAMNKGLRHARGDLIAILNADDSFADSKILEKVITSFSKNPDIDAVLTNVRFYKANVSTGERIFTRYVKASWFKPKRLAFGWMPPHPGIFFRRNVYSDFGFFDDSYNICGDYEFVVRSFYKGRISYLIRDVCSVHMREGGASTRNIKSNLIITSEIVRACRQNGVRSFFWIVLLRLPIKWLLIKMGFK